MISCNIFLVAFIMGMTTCLAWDHLQQVQDTPEVAAAKAAHLAAHSKAKEKAREHARYGQDGWDERENKLKDGRIAAWKNSWKEDSPWDAPKSESPYEDDGNWKGDDSWKNYDDGAWEEDETTTEKPKPEQRWTGPVALPPGYDETGAPLPVEDTPEVADAKAKHLLLYAKAASRSQSAPLQASITSPTHQNYQQPKKNAIFKAPGKPKVRPPPERSAPPPYLPAPVWETNDEVQDTPEVAAAKAAHFAAHAKRRT